MKALLALPLALAGIVLLGVIEFIERREAKRERERLDRVLGRVLEDIAEEDAERERETVRPNMRAVSDFQWVRSHDEAHGDWRTNAPGGDA